MLAFLIMRRRRQKKRLLNMSENEDKNKNEEENKVEDKNKIEEKAQLHADSFLRYELPNQSYRDQMSELPALEPVGSELPSEPRNRESQNDWRAD
jgi:hypothetical protein